MKQDLHKLTTVALLNQLNLELRVTDAKRFWLISRVKDDDWRRHMGLGDGWQIHKMYKDEADALGDMIYLNSEAALRTYALFAELPCEDGLDIKPWSDDTLDDDIPF